MTVRSTMRGLFGWLSAKSKTQCRVRRPNSANRRFRATLAGCEPLEDRRLLAGDVMLEGIRLHQIVPPHADWANVSTSTDTPLDVTILDRVNDPNYQQPLFWNNWPVRPYEIYPSTVAVQQDPLHGSTSVDLETGVITYTPDPGFTGDDFFFYTVKDHNNSFSNQGRISITVDAVERPYKNPWERFDENK